MNSVLREDLLDYVTYSEQRDEIRKKVIQIKKARRIHLGDCLTFLFENKDTVRYQVQEMMRVEKLVKEEDIKHELKTYNELLGDSGELGCTLLIEIDNEEERNIKLKEWLELPKHLYLKLEDGTRIPATFDERQIGDDRLSSVQFLKFDPKGESPIAIGADHPNLSIETMLSETQKQALNEDLSQK